MERFHLLYKQRWIKVFGILLVTILSYADEKAYEEKEQKLGFFKLGRTYEEAIYGDYSKDQWGFWVDEDDKILKGISYKEMNIRDNYNYPKTSKGVTIGSRLEEVEQAYGAPQKILSARSWFVLRNSELSVEYIYPSNGLWIMFINQEPYSDTRDWRVVDIAIGDVIESRLIGAPVYATWFLTEDKKDSITMLYVKKYGRQKELEIYDDYILNREMRYFEYIKSKGAYRVTFLTILPKEKGSALLTVLFNKGSRFWKNTERLAQKKTALKYNISLERMERITKKVEHFKSTEAYEEIVELDYIQQWRSRQ